jgi:hypothetical protein
VTARKAPESIIEIRHPDPAAILLALTNLPTHKQYTFRDLVTRTADGILPELYEIRGTAGQKVRSMLSEKIHHGLCKERGQSERKTETEPAGKVSP